MSDKLSGRGLKQLRSNTIDKKPKHYCDNCRCHCYAQCGCLKPSKRK